MQGEVDARCAVGQHIVERGIAARLLQAVDAAIAAVVEHDDDQFFVEHDGGGDFRIHHQIAAVAHHDDDFRLRLRHLDAQAAGDFITHARVAVFHMVAARCRCSPQLVQLGRQGTGRADDNVAGGGILGGTLHGADDFAVVWQAGHFPFAGNGQHGGAPRMRLLLCPLQPLARAVPATQQPRQSLQAQGRVRLHAQAAAFQRIESVDVQADQLRLRKQGVGPRREILQARADGQHHVRVRRQRVRGGRSGDADGAQLQRMVPRQGTFAGLGFRHGNAVPFGKRLQGGAGLAVQHAATGDDQGLFRVLQQQRRLFQLLLDGRHGAEAHGPRFEEIGRIIVGHRLHVLRQGQGHGTAGGRVRQGGNRARQGREQLLRIHDAVEIARQRFKSIVDGDAAVRAIFQLLQDGVRCARDKHVAGQQEHGQAVDVGQRGRRQQVGGAGTDGSGDGQHAQAHVGFRVGDGRVRHRLFIVGAVGGKLLAVLV